MVCIWEEFILWGNLVILICKMREKEKGERLTLRFVHHTVF